MEEEGIVLLLMLMLMLMLLIDQTRDPLTRTPRRCVPTCMVPT